MHQCGEGAQPLQQKLRTVNDIPPPQEGDQVLEPHVVGAPDLVDPGAKEPPHENNRRPAALEHHFSPGALQHSSRAAALLGAGASDDAGHMVLV